MIFREANRKSKHGVITKFAVFSLFSVVSAVQEWHVQKLSRQLSTNLSRYDAVPGTSPYTETGHSPRRAPSIVVAPIAVLYTVRTVRWNLP